MATDNPIDAGEPKTSLCPTCGEPATISVEMPGRVTTGECVNLHSTPSQDLIWE
jgi:hypothetical protein